MGYDFSTNTETLNDAELEEQLKILEDPASDWGLAHGAMETLSRFMCLLNLTGQDARPRRAVENFRRNRPFPTDGSDSP